jgi:hypothetical protein
MFCGFSFGDWVDGEGGRDLFRGKVLSIMSFIISQE